MRQKLYLLPRLHTVVRVILQPLPHQYLYSLEMPQGSLGWSFVDFEPLAIGALFDLLVTRDATARMLTEAS